MAPLVPIGLLMDIISFHELEQYAEMVSISNLHRFVHWKYRISVKETFSNNAGSRGGIKGRAISCVR